MQLSYQHVNKRSAISPTDNARRQQNGSAQHADAGPSPAASAESAAGRISPEGGGARSFKQSGEPACGVQPIKAHHLQSAKLHTHTHTHTHTQTHRTKITMKRGYDLPNVGRIQGRKMRAHEKKRNREQISEHIDRKSTRLNS